MASPSSCIRKITAQEVHEAWLLDMQGFPIGESTAEETFEIRQRVTPDLFWGYFEDSHLIGITSATKTSKNELTLDSMFTPDPDGKVVCLHSLCVHQEHRKKGIATQLMKHFIQFVKENLRDVTKVCLLCHDVLIPMYEQFGFRCLGLSAVVHGPTPWYDMVYSFPREDESSVVMSH